jgi:hypothetical protein
MYSYLNRNFMITNLDKNFIQRSLLLPSVVTYPYRHSYVPARDIHSRFYADEDFWCKFPNFYEKSY